MMTDKGKMMTSGFFEYQFTFLWKICREGKKRLAERNAREIVLLFRLTFAKMASKRKTATTDMRKTYPKRTSTAISATRHTENQPSPPHHHHAYFKSPMRVESYVAFNQVS